jgi:hypothetical protein
MPKWSDYIRDLGTAGPATLQGIRGLGFALVSDFPTQLAKYVRVDAAQAFTAPEKLQGRENLDLGSVDNTSDADKPISDDTQAALDLKAPLESPALTGTPTAPTAAGGTETTQIATTAFVAAAAGAWERISVTDLSDVASWTATDLSAFRKLRVTGFMRPATDNAFTQVRTSTNNGSSYDAGASDYRYQSLRASGATVTAAVAAAADSFSFSITGVGNVTTEEGVQFKVEIDQFNQTTRVYFNASSNLVNPTGDLNIVQASGQRMDTAARNALEITFSSGNISFGQIVLEGVRS